MCLWRLLKSKVYPRAVLPHSVYKPLIDTQKLIEQVSGLLVARRLDDEWDNCVEKKDGAFFFRLNALGEIKHLSQMSLDLLGACYNPLKHQRYRTIGKGSSVWDKKTIYWLAPLSSFYYWRKPCCSVAIDAYRLNNIKFPYMKTLNKQQHDELVGKGINIEKFSSKKEYKLEGELRLDHIPTLLNYWHMQADSRPAGEENPMKGETKGWRGDYLKQLVQYLLAIPVHEIGSCNISVVPKDFYCNCG